MKNKNEDVDEYIHVTSNSGTAAWHLQTVHEIESGDIVRV